MKHQFITQKCLGCFMTLPTALILLSGCEDDGITTAGNDSTQKESKVPFTISATISPTKDATKTYLDTSNMTPYWKSGDKIGLSAFSSGDTLNNLPFSLDSESAGKAIGVFSADDQSIGWPDPALFIAIYPYNAGSTITGPTSSRIYNTSFPHEQGVIAGSDGNFSSGMMIARAYGIDELTSNLSFENLFSILVIPIMNENATDDLTVNSIVFRDLTEMPVSGSFTYGFKNDDLIFPSIPVNSTDRSIQLTANQVISPNSVQNFYLTVPSRSYASGFVIEVNTDAGIMTKRRVTPQKLWQGYYYTMSQISFIADSNVTDLSKDGTSNCYIAVPSNAAKQYSFTATVVGNGTPGYLDLSNVTTKFYPSFSSINPMSAKLLWEDNSGLISNVSLSSGKVTFTAAASLEGNAVIAVYDNADPDNGNILWSWHIWCTDTPEDLDANATVKIMDRNLGSIRSTRPPSNSSNEEIISGFGLLYQWGRKDPFPGCSIPGSASERFLYNADNPSGSIDLIAKLITSATIGTIQYAVQNPTTFIRGSTTSAYDWYYGGGNLAANRNNFLWGNPQGDAANPSTAKKSIYDPCPLGYMVREAFNVVPELAGSGDYFYGFEEKISVNGSVTWLPAAGLRLYDDGTVDSDISKESHKYNCLVWGNFPNECGDQNMAYAIYQSNSDLFYGIGDFERANGLSIRCVRE